MTDEQLANYFATQLIETLGEDEAEATLFVDKHCAIESEEWGLSLAEGARLALDAGIPMSAERTAAFQVLAGDKLDAALFVAAYGADAYQEKVLRAPNWMDWVIHQAAIGPRRLLLDSPTSRGEIAKIICWFIRLIPDPISREMAIGDAAIRTRISSPTLKATINQL